MMAEALEEIVVAKRQRYEDWRHRHLSTPFLTRVQRRTVRFLLASALPAAAIAFAATHSFDRQKMGTALKDSSSNLGKKVFGRHGSGSSKKQRSSQSAAAALEAAPAAVPATAGKHTAAKVGSAGAAAALHEAEVALKAAEAAQKAALDELQRSSSKPQQQQQKKGWF